MDLEAIGYRAARGQPVDLDNVEVSEHRAENALAEYEGALLHVFDAATGSKVTDCTRAVQHLIAAAHTLVACCLTGVQDLDLLEESVRLAANTRDSLRVLDPRHWRREDLIGALRASGATEFRGRWAPLVDVC